VTAPQYVLALDLGTTGNRAIAFDANGAIAGQAYRALTPTYPHPGWMEHDPNEIWQASCALTQQLLQQLDASPGAIATLGLTVQRETCLLWDRITGEPLHPAIVWQDRRTAERCRELAQQGYAQLVRERTGLVLDAYFSASKLAWLLAWVGQHRPDIGADRLLAGTVDTWVLWKLTGGRTHATDPSNASRTLLMDLGARDWDDALLDLFGIPRRILPAIRASLGDFGRTDAAQFGTEIPITAVLGDQQASLFAHGCDRPGQAKCTHGTGSFLVAYAGSRPVPSRHQLLSTVAWTDATQAGAEAAHYALESSILTSGACLQWLQDGLGLIASAAETEELARQVPDTQGAYFVPALSGLGAPHWDMRARGAFIGLMGGVERAHLVRAVLEAIAYRVKEGIDAMNRDSATPISQLRADGGVAQNDWLMQFQADLLGIPVERPAVLELTAQGAAFAAGLASGFWHDYDALARQRAIARTFEPGEGSSARQAFARWCQARERAQNWALD